MAISGASGPMCFRLVARAEPSNLFARGGSARSEEGYGQPALSTTQLLPLQVAEPKTGLCGSLQRLYLQACDEAHVHAVPGVGISFGQGLPHESVPPVLPLLVLTLLVDPLPAPPAPPAPPVPLAELVVAVLVEVLVVVVVVLPLPVLPLVLVLSPPPEVGPLVSTDGESVQLMTAALMIPKADKKNDKRTIVDASREIVILNLIGRKRSSVNATLCRFVLRR